MNLSVIISVHDQARALRRCLESIAASRLGSYEVLVMDEGSTDGSYQIARILGFRAYRWKGQMGRWVGRDLGAALSRGEILVFMDADICVREETLSRIAGYFSKGRHGVVGGVMAPRSLEDNFVSHYKDAWVHHSYAQFSEEITWTSTKLMAVERSVFFQTGGFRDHFGTPLDGRDMEFGGRVIRAGFSIFLDKGLEVDHGRRFSLGQVLRNDFWGSSRAMQLVLASGKAKGNLRRMLFAHLPVNFIAGAIFASLTAASLIISLWAPGVLRWALLWLLLYVLSKIRLLRFYRDTFGGAFAWRALPMSLLDHLASGLGMVAGGWRFWQQRRRAKKGLSR